jgi:hypothetical protein
MWEKWVNGRLVAQPSAPQKPRAVRAGPDLRPAKRRLKKRLVAQLREARRAAIARSRPTAHRDPSSSGPRLHAAPAQVVAAAGRDGNGERDDGSGGDSDSGGGGGGEPPQRLITAARRGRDRNPLAGGAS